MHVHTFVFPDLDPFPLLDDEFDTKTEAASLSGDHSSVEPAMLGDDRAWEDQLDNGEEVSL